MGQKVNPIGLRLGINRTWDSRWYAEGDEYSKMLHEDIHIRKCAVDETGAHACGVQVTHWGISKIAFTFYGQEFSFNPLWPLLGGFVINGISAFIGVGGGFLYVPFLTSVAGLPMFIVGQVRITEQSY